MADRILRRRYSSNGRWWTANRKHHWLYSFDYQFHKGREVMIWRKILFILGCTVAGVFGMIVTAWWKEPFPVNTHHRYQLTPIIASGSENLIGLDLFRENNCPMTVMRRITYSDGSPQPITQEIDKNFGPLGADQYVLRIPIASSAPYGPAQMWTRACARCNPVHYIHPLLEVCSREVIDRFEIGNQTVYKSGPDHFKPHKELTADPRY